MTTAYIPYVPKYETTIVELLKYEIGSTYTHFVKIMVRQHEFELQVPCKFTSLYFTNAVVEKFIGFVILSTHINIERYNLYKYCETQTLTRNMFHRYLRDTCGLFVWSGRNCLYYHTVNGMEWWVCQDDWKIASAHVVNIFRNEMNIFWLDSLWSIFGNEIRQFARKFRFVDYK